MIRYFVTYEIVWGKSLILLCPIPLTMDKEVTNYLNWQTKTLLKVVMHKWEIFFFSKHKAFSRLYSATIIELPSKIYDYFKYNYFRRHRNQCYQRYTGRTGYFHWQPAQQSTTTSQPDEPSPCSDVPQQQQQQSQRAIVIIKLIDCYKYLHSRPEDLNKRKK